eukprot:365608-Chlamydomonas_euryale.AAC.22
MKRSLPTTPPRQVQAAAGSGQYTAIDFMLYVRRAIKHAWDMACRESIEESALQGRHTTW